MKSILVIGIGRFGKNLAMKLSELDNEVLIIDRHEDRVSELVPFVTRAQIGDCTDENLLRSLGVGNFDICFVCIGSNFQASLEITSLLKDLGAKFVVSKADRDIHEKFLLRNGADVVIYPERDVALRAARKYSAQNVFDYIQLSDDFSIYEIQTPKHWVGKSLRQLNVRSLYNVNILAVKSGGSTVPATDADHVFTGEEHLFIAGNSKNTAALLSADNRFTEGTSKRAAISADHRQTADI